MADHRRSLEKLAKWRTVFTGWQLGTMDKSTPGVPAVRDHWEKLILLRAEVTALTGLLIRKGVFDAAEFTQALGEEAEQLSQDYARSFPGMEATDDGIRMDRRAAQTMRDKGFPV